MAGLLVVPLLIILSRLWPFSKGELGLVPDRLDVSELGTGECGDDGKTASAVAMLFAPGTTVEGDPGLEPPPPPTPRHSHTKASILEPCYSVLTRKNHRITDPNIHRVPLLGRTRCVDANYYPALAIKLSFLHALNSTRSGRASASFVYLYLAKWSRAF